MKKWTVLVWMAGDNDLEQFGVADIKELKQTGSTQDVDVVVQFDSMQDDKTRRYHLSAGAGLAADLVEELGETNTGDPAVATGFFVWGIKRFPAERYLAVLWNHGSGIDETDIYKKLAGAGVRVVRRGVSNGDGVARRRVRAVASRRWRRSLFSTTVEQAVGRRAIALDDTSRDFLDNIELHKVLAAVKKQTGRKIDLLGFDACLMNMIEIAYQLRQTAEYIVGSEEVEPGDGWPYDRILADLVAKPGMTPRELGSVIVRHFVESYQGESVTQSLLNLAQASSAAAAVDGMGKALIAAIGSPAEYAAVTKAILAAQHYDFRDFIDLYDLCEQLRKRTKSARVKKSAAATMAALSGNGAALVAAEKHKGKAVARSHGVAIYFPRGEVTVAYDRLDFARATHWDEFMEKYNPS